VASGANESPAQATPPHEGAGLLHVRVLVRVTLPQVPDHVPNVHEDQPPATAGKTVSTRV
jgi:hypothetical protein